MIVQHDAGPSAGAHAALVDGPVSASQVRN